MAGRTAILVLAATVLAAAHIPLAEAKTLGNAGTQVSGSASHRSSQTDAKPKAKSLRGKRNPSDQGREH
jgi:hypothetical protein